jgi:hypothetical protein
MSVSPVSAARAVFFLSLCNIFVFVAIERFCVGDFAAFLDLLNIYIL